MSIPLNSLAPRLDAQRPREASASPADVSGLMRESLSDAPLEVTVAFQPAAIDSSRVFTLDPGDVVMLGHAVGAPLDVLVGDVRIAHAIAGKAGSKLAALIVDDTPSAVALTGAISHTSARKEHA